MSNELSLDPRLVLIDLESNVVNVELRAVTNAKNDRVPILHLFSTHLPSLSLEFILVLSC